MNIDGNTIQEIKTLLVASMTTIADREALLFRAFGTDHPLLGKISFDGSTKTFLTRLIQFLVKYNDSADELILLLETVKTDVRLDRQERIDRIINSLKASQQLSRNSQPGASKLQDLYSIKDLVPYYTYVKLEKLREIGVKGSGIELFQLIEKWGHDDLTLRLLGGYLVHYQKRGIEQPYPEPSQELSLDDPSVGIEEILGFFDRDLIVTDKLKSLLKTATTFCEDIPDSLVKEASELVDWGFLQCNTKLEAYTMPKPIRTYYIRKRNQAAIKIINSWFEEKK